jgi:dTDP-4-dehydrorhamnose reductase
MPLASSSSLKALLWCAPCGHGARIGFCICKNRRHRLYSHTVSQRLGEGLPSAGFHQSPHQKNGHWVAQKSENSSLVILELLPKTYFAFQSDPFGALPARFRRERLLIIGCGDVGMRLARVQGHMRTFALTSQQQRITELREAGITPLLGNLDQPSSLKRLAGLATRVVHLAPPPLQGHHDPRTLALARALMLRTAPSSVVYGSTSGVYGDCEGEWVAESRIVNPKTSRAQRRVDAEQRLRHLARLRGNAVQMRILRIPGIYANDRVGGTPRDRLTRGTAVLQIQDDVFTNHIHANDLARACQLAMWRGKTQRAYNINDDSQMLMGDYFDMAAGVYGLPKPPRISRAQAKVELGEMQMSFMSESRRLINTRMKRELRLRLLYPQVQDGLEAQNLHLKRD